MPPTMNVGRTVYLCAALFCVVSLSACPSDDDGPAADAGSSNGDAGAAAGHSGGTGGHVAGSGGKAEAGSGKAGTGGTAANGSGGSGGTSDPGDEDAGVSAGKLCGTRGAGECEADQFCNFEPDKDCGATDRGGMCETTPKGCPKNILWVCGCDNRSYTNECVAHSAGVSVKHEGTCSEDECTSNGGHVAKGMNASCKANEDSFPVSDKPDAPLCCVAKPAEGKTCGGIANLQCGPNEFCNYDMGQGCGGTVADAAGKCAVKPDACTEQYAPVCSCERKTLSNECDAHSMSASLLHQGACTVSDCDKVGGRVAVGIGPAPMCNSDEVEYTHIINDDGSMAIEGMLCCTKK